MKMLLCVTMGAAILTACGDTVAPVDPGEPRFSQAPVLVERAWGAGQMWEFVKPRSPGLGADPARATPLYVIAPVDPADPLSPPIELPGMIAVGGRDHVVPLPAQNRGGYSGIARTVPLEVPGWTWFLEPFCAPPAVQPSIAWDWVEVTAHPCGRVAVVYAVQLAGEACPTPLITVERVEAAIAQGLATPAFPDEGGPWPFAIRPVTQPGRGLTTSAGPTGCVAPGPRSG